MVLGFDDYPVRWRYAICVLELLAILEKGFDNTEGVLDTLCCGRDIEIRITAILRRPLNSLLITPDNKSFVFEIEFEKEDLGIKRD